MEKYLIGQRVIYNDEIATVIPPPRHANKMDARDQWYMWIMRPSVGHESFVARGNVEPLPGGQL